MRKIQKRYCAIGYDRNEFFGFVKTHGCLQRIIFTSGFIFIGCELYENPFSFGSLISYQKMTATPATIDWNFRFDAHYHFIQALLIRKSWWYDLFRGCNFIWISEDWNVTHVRGAPRLPPINKTRKTFRFVGRIYNLLGIYLMCLQYFPLIWFYYNFSISN